MTPEFLAAVIDTLLPGDEVLPSGTAAGLDPSLYRAKHQDVFDAIIAQSGGELSFVRADSAQRVTQLQTVEQASPDKFRAVLTAVLTDYCESQPALAALGWRIDPPQPGGHGVQEIDHRTARMKDRVERRNQLWRG